MKKLYSLLFLLLLSFGLLTGCGDGKDKQVKEDDSSKNTEQVDQAETAAFPVTIKDALDNEVVIEEKPAKIVSLIPSNTEIAFELGLGDEIVGVSDFDNYPEEAAKKEKIGGMEFNVEKIISLSPDLVLAHESTALNSTEGLQQLRDSGIKVFVVDDAQSIDAVYESILMVGKATGTVKEAETTVKAMKEKLAEIESKIADIADKKVVYVEVGPAPENYTTGKNTFMDGMLTILKAENVAGDQEGWVIMDQEALLQKNPDVIITTYGDYVEDPIGQVMNRDGWQDVSAVKNKQVADVNSDLVTRSGPRIIEGIEELAKAIYPEIFKNE
ncbi:ABC transporter substrate-binding protein [Ferdinandcohnia quinoae]|uniref:ABC transporter substrate-binding protein n=1 Tax=Fredinandcohnia quinoae TaxID=2918902 RepID=A0AAW5E6A9_9BACI|nr:ABC transporter substrate-binding protein [Fredinandcohnia sp. SECRCQ15]MCH1626419.1 ABC transporter substrate-binding protein [Fredinandcohnia sp. SECRCQ15]